MYGKVVPLEIWRNSPLTGVTALQFTGYNTSKNELVTKFLKGVWKFSERAQEELCN